VDSASSDSDVCKESKVVSAKSEDVNATLPVFGDEEMLDNAISDGGKVSEEHFETGPEENQEKEKNEKQGDEQDGDDSNTGDFP
jgi:hypothetical protein